MSKGRKHRSDGPQKAARDNRANQLNPNNDKYHRSRGLEGGPDKPGSGSPPTARQP